MTGATKLHCSVHNAKTVGEVSENTFVKLAVIYQVTHTVPQTWSSCYINHSFKIKIECLHTTGGDKSRL